jgi:hypothetical protein
MRRTSKGSVTSYLLKPLCVVILLTGAFGLVWLRSSVTSAAYNLSSLEDQRTAALKEMKTRLAERSRLMALSNLDRPGGKQAPGEKKLASGGFVFPDRVKVVQVKRSRGPEAYKASFRQRAGE